MALDNLTEDLQIVPFSETLLAAYLPDRFRHRYDADFIERFVAVLRSMHIRITGGTIERLASPIEEIAVAVLEESAVAMAQVNAELGWSIAEASDSEHVTELRDAIAEDTDIEVLWGPELDGAEEDPDVMRIYGYEDHLRFENWFRPYRPGS